MKITLLCFLAAVSFLPVFGQQDSVLKNFKFRNANFRAVNFNIGGGSQYNKSELASGTIKNSSAGGSLGAGYYTAKSTDRILLTGSALVNVNFNTNRSSSPGGTDKNRHFSVQPVARILNKWYSKNNFIELGADVFGSTNHNKTDNESNSPGISKYQQSQYTIAVNTGIGKGRLENITDMQNALWLNKALEKAGSLLRPLSSQELNELGRTITKANNTRVLDARKRTQFVLATVDHFFQQQSAITKTDINYFSNLNDILFFAFNSPRLSGTEKFIRFTPAISGYKVDNIQNQIIDKFEHRSNVKMLTLSTGLNKYSPANLVHQNNYGALLKLNYSYVDFADRYLSSGVITNEIRNNADIKQVGIDLFFEHAIYPNTRTIINFNLRPQGGYQDIDQQTSFFGSVDLSGSVNYFISYRTRVTCGLSGIYTNNVHQVNQYVELLPNTIRLYANVGLDINL